MYCVKKMTEDLYWVGASERRLNLFENAYPLTNGVSYNSYIILDEKIAVVDGVRYGIYRTYRAKNETLELYLEAKAGI